jgi:Na+/H+-dicarboxylate symporter
MKPPKARRTISTKIGIALAAGITLGLLVGERASPLNIVADAYIKLLQMTVLPFVTVSIVGGVGALSGGQARALAKQVGIVLLLLWALSLTMVFIFPLMFPAHESASFFSTTLVQEREPFDFLNLYIPTNPFNSLANNIVPAVVLFSLIVGVALITIPEKARLLEVLAVVSGAVSKATHFIVALTPYGVFAIAAVVAGTLSLDELERLRVYLISYVGISLLLSFWLLPGLVAALTPVPYRAIVSRTRDALVMAFMTTSLLAVLPLLTEQAKALVREYAGVDERQSAAVDVVVPASFNFPHTGKVLSLSFVLFAGWFAEAHVAAADYPKLASTGLLTMFGNVNAAIVFLLDLLHIPADTFHLFVTSGIVNARFGTLVAAMHTLAVAILGTCAVTGTLHLNLKKIGRFAVISVIATAAVIGGTRILLADISTRPYDKDQLLTSMGMLRDRGSARVFRNIADAPPLPAVKTSVLDRVRDRGVLRVGYFDDSLPYVFFNVRGELVGLDAEMAMQLARDLGVTAEFVPVSRTVLDEGLDPALCDIVMSGAVITADRAARVQYSASYLDETVAFLVPDHLMTAFTEWSSIRAMGHLRLGVPRAPYFVRKVRDELTDIDVVPIDRLDDVLTARDPPIDAVVTTAERGSAYTLLHPQYSIAVPRPRPFKVPLAYVIAGRDATLTSFVNTWIELKRKDDTVDDLFGHWILGQDSTPKQPRWSVLHDVLHWL